MTDPLILTYIVFLPLAGAFVVFALKPDAARRVALLFTAAEASLCAWLYASLGFSPAPGGGWLIVADHAWIERFGVRYTLSLDGISLLMVTLSALLFMLSVGVSWKSVKERVSLFHGLLLVMQTGIMGVFLATDLFLFYLFWELMLVPMFFIIGVWGHGRRVYSAVKFFIYTITGSLLMLLALIGLYVMHAAQTGEHSFALDALTRTSVSPAAGLMLFGAFLLAFGVKVPLFPIHGWLPDAHTDAPTAGSVILAGLLLKTGAYGLIRFGVPLFPAAAAGMVALVYALGLAGLFYASWVAFAQSDMKRLVAYSSVSHLGLVVVGIAAWNHVSLAGSVLQMVNHGITTGALFIMVGMMDERAHTRELSAYGGLWGKAPVLSSFFLLFVLSSAGLPGLNNFPGEFMIFMGVFRDNPALGAAAFAGIVATLVYLLRLAQKVLFGQEAVPAPAGGEFRDVTPRELVVLGSLGILVVALGFFPSLVLRPLDAPVDRLVGMMLEARMHGGGVMP